MLEIRADKPLYANEIQLHLVERMPNGSLRIAKVPEFETIDPNDFWHEPAIRLTTTSAQQLMDELWRCGLRPSEGTGSAGSLAATERHLKDMQTIAFHFINKGE